MSESKYREVRWGPRELDYSLRPVKTTVRGAHVTTGVIDAPPPPWYRSREPIPIAVCGMALSLIGLLWGFVLGWIAHGLLR